MIGWTNADGGGVDSSDDCTLVLKDVPKGSKAITADSDDEAKEGTLDTTTTVDDSNVLSGKSYMKYNPTTKHWEKRTGTEPERGAWTGSVGMNGKVAIPGGHHNGGGYVKGPTITQRNAWTSSVAMNSKVPVPEGYHNGSGYVNGPSITNRGGYGGFGNSHGNDMGNQRMWVRIPNGYYNENANVYLSWADIRSMAGLTADKLKKGVSIMGLIGSFEGSAENPLYLWKPDVSDSWEQGLDGFHMLYTSGNEDYVSSWGETARYGNYYHFLVQACARGDIIIFKSRNPINLTDYTHLKITVTTTTKYMNPMYIGLSTNGALTNTSWAASASFGTVDDGTYDINISNLNGNHYIYFYIRMAIGISRTSSTTAYLSIKSCWLT